LGGWLGIEMVKIGLQIRQRTGDVYLLPMALGLSLGRVGCFLTGLSDGTHGNPSFLPWAVDFGDGIPRHPSQLYESLFVLIWGLALYFGLFRVQSPGSRFRLFMAGYLLFRFGSEWLKPVMMIYGGLSAIAWASLLGAVYCLISVWRPGALGKVIEWIGPYVFYELTNGVCSTCLQKVEAKVLFQQNNVYLQKFCPQHGLQKVLISTDVDYYLKTRSLLKPGQMPYAFNTPDEPGLSL
jgi:hypothetical protein